MSDEDEQEYCFEQLTFVDQPFGNTTAYQPRGFLTETAEVRSDGKALQIVCTSPVFPWPMFLNLFLYEPRGEAEETCVVLDYIEDVVEDLNRNHIPLDTVTWFCVPEVLP